MMTNVPYCSTPKQEHKADFDNMTSLNLQELFFLNNKTEYIYSPVFISVHRKCIIAFNKRVGSYFNFICPNGVYIQLCNYKFFGLSPILDSSFRFFLDSSPELN